MVVRMRHTRAHTANRRSHHALEAIKAVKCSNCGAMKKAHTVCAACGVYRGKQVIDVVANVARKQARTKAVSGR